MIHNKTETGDDYDNPTLVAAYSETVPFPSSIEIARQPRARDLRAMLIAIPDRSRMRPVAVASAASIISVASVIAYASLLSRTGVPEAAPAMLAVLLASTLSSIAGFAFSAICGVMLLQLMPDPVSAVRIMMVCSIAIQSLSVGLLRRDIDWRTLPPLLLGGALGLPFGLWLLLNLGHAGAREAIGGLLTAYAIYALLKRPLTVRGGGVVADGVHRFRRRDNRRPRGVSRGGRDDLVRHEGMGQAPSARGVSAVHPDHAGPGAGSDAVHARAPCTAMS